MNLWKSDIKSCVRPIWKDNSNSNIDGNSNKYRNNNRRLSHLAPDTKYQEKTVAQSSFSNTLNFSLSKKGALVLYFYHLKISISFLSKLSSEKLEQSVWRVHLSVYANIVHVNQRKLNMLVRAYYKYPYSPHQTVKRGDSSTPKASIN